MKQEVDAIKREDRAAASFHGALDDATSITPFNAEGIARKARPCS
jgi:hypothetical protein